MKVLTNYRLSIYPNKHSVQVDPRSAALCEVSARAIPDAFGDSANEGAGDPLTPYLLERHSRPALQFVLLHPVVDLLDALSEEGEHLLTPRTEGFENQRREAHICGSADGVVLTCFLRFTGSSCPEANVCCSAYDDG